MSQCQKLRDLESFATRHQFTLTSALSIVSRRPLSDTAFRFFLRLVDVADPCAPIRYCIISLIPSAASDLGWLVTDGETLRGSLEQTSSAGSTFIAQLALFSASLDVPHCFAEAR